MLKTDLKRNLPFSWFKIVAGTGMLGNILYQSPLNYELGHCFGIFLAGLASILYLLVFILLLVFIPGITRQGFISSYKRHLAPSFIMNIPMSMSAATVTVGTNVCMIWADYLELFQVYIIAVSAWIMAMIAVLFVIGYTTKQVFRTKLSFLKDYAADLEWLPISSLTLLLIGNPVLGMTVEIFPVWAFAILTVHMLLLNTGIFLFVFFMGFVFVRFAKCPHCLTEIGPLSPGLFGLSGLIINALLDAFMNLRSMGLLGSLDLVYLLVLGLWGFGLWLFIFFSLNLLDQHDRSDIAGSARGWNYIFYLGVYILAGNKIGEHFPSPLITGIIAALTMLSVLLWLFNIGLFVRKE